MPETTINLLAGDELRMSYKPALYEVLFLCLRTTGPPSSDPAAPKEPPRAISDSLDLDAIDEAIDFLSEARDAIAYRGARGRGRRIGRESQAVPR